jgi:hypothetical protein
MVFGLLGEISALRKLEAAALAAMANMETKDLGR